MVTFTISEDNNIIAFAQTPAGADQTESFSSEKELAKLTADWPASRLIETWNSFAGAAPFDDLKPVKKFTDRKAAVARIWKAIQRLTPAPAPQATPVASKKAPSKKSAVKGEGRATAPKGGTDARGGSKKAEVLDLLRRKQGATLNEIMNATGWQAHSVRGFISGALIKKQGLKVESFRNEGKERTYKIG